MVIWYFCNLTIILCNLEGLCFFENNLSTRSIDLRGLLCHACHRDSDAFLPARQIHKALFLDLGVTSPYVAEGICDKKQTEWPFCSKSPNMTWSVAFT